MATRTPAHIVNALVALTLIAAYAVYEMLAFRTSDAWLLIPGDVGALLSLLGAVVLATSERYAWWAQLSSSWPWLLALYLCGYRGCALAS